MVNNKHKPVLHKSFFFFFNLIRLLSLFQSHCHRNAKQISNFCKFHLYNLQAEKIQISRRNYFCHRGTNHKSESGFSRGDCAANGSSTVDQYFTLKQYVYLRSPYCFVQEFIWILPQFSKHWLTITMIIPFSLCSTCLDASG